MKPGRELSKICFAFREPPGNQMADTPRSGGTSYQAPGLPVELQTNSISFRLGEHLADMKSTAGVPGSLPC